MFLVSRIATLRGAPSDVVPAATAVCDRVNDVTGLGFGVWTALAGYPSNTYAWSASVESQAHYAEGAAALGTDAAYNDAVKDILAYATGPAEQNVRELIHPQGENPDPLPVGAVAWVVSAQAAPGKLGSAGAFAVEIADFSAGITGALTGVFRDLYGPWGTYTWITGYESVAAMEDAAAKANADPGWLERIDGGGSNFIPGAATSGVVQRIH